MDFISGVHSIYHAIINPKRSGKKLYVTDKGLKDLKALYPALNNDLKKITVEQDSLDDFTKKTQKIFQTAGAEYKRLTGQALLVAGPLPEYEVNDLFQLVESREEIKLLALDQVTDVHNAAAIVRTAAFFNFAGIIINQKNSFGLTSAFFRNASGAAEYVPLYRSSVLSRTLTQLTDRAVVTVGLSEEAKSNQISPNLKKICLVLGAEETGLSNAVERVLEYHISLPHEGKIQSLNVSVAAALAMQKFSN